MRMTQLRAFDCVAREGSVSRAAERLGLTQPALTIQVRSLEEAYGIKVFDRGPRGVELTDAGRRIYRMTRQLFGMEEEIAHFLAETRDLHTGNLRIVADGPAFVIDLVAAFKTRYPGIDVSVSLANTQQAWSDLRDLWADAAVVTQTDRSDQVVSVPLGRQTVVVLVPVEHRWKDRKSLSVGELDGEAAVVREAESNTQRLVDRAMQDSDSALNRIAEFNTREAIREAVAAGLGIGFALEREAGHDPRIRAIRLKGLEAKSRDVLAVLKSQSRRGTVAALLDLARGHKVVHGPKPH